MGRWEFRPANKTLGSTPHKLQLFGSSKTSRERHVTKQVPSQHSCQALQLHSGPGTAGRAEHSPGTVTEGASCSGQSPEGEGESEGLGDLSGRGDFPGAGEGAGDGAGVLELRCPADHATPSPAR